jgi:hypothetical protein
MCYADVMARQETDKEDLLREATALVERVELSRVGELQTANITVGFRPNGAASIFFGVDPVYHFNAAGELRRAFCDGLLFKATHGRLVSLRRIRQQGEVQLLRHELTEAEQGGFLARMRDLLSGLASALGHGEFEIRGQVPSDAEVVARLKAWLTQHDGTKIAAMPHVDRPGK